jgi:hypothetical protein
MNGMSRQATGIPGLPLAILLSLSMMSGAWAADAPAPTAADAAAAPPAAEQLEELDQIVVRGKRLAREISDVEDAFFAVYNKLNKDYDFSITCGEAPMNPGSRITLRACLPGFVVDAYRYNYRGERAGFASYPTVRRCNSIAHADTNGEMFYTADYDCLNAGGMTYGSGAYYAGPSPEALVSARSREWAVHMMMVINSDPRLKEIAGHLAGLYQEFNSVRTRYDRNRSAQPDAKPTRVNLGPRAL